MIIGRSALVLKEFSINYNGPEYVHIVARKAGLVAWLFTLLGIDVTTTFKVFGDHIELHEGSLSGRLQTVMPLKSISITTAGYLKPIKQIAMAVLFLIGAIVSIWTVIVPIILLIFLVVSLIFYFLNKSLMISVVSNSGWPTTICFKRSVIEGVKIEYSQAQEVINIINQLLLQ